MSEAPDETMGTDDIAGRTKRGLLWRFAAQGVAGVIELGVGIVLARLLMPEDFGIMALAYMVMGFVAMFQTIGLPQALVQREVIDEDHKAAAFWTTMLMGFVLAGVIILLAGPAAVFFKEEAVRPVMRLMSVTMVLGATASVPRALLERRIDFKRLFWPDIVGGAVYGAVGITMAVLGYSYWSLAWGAIARGAASLVVVTTMARYAPRLTCRLQPLRDLFSFGGYKALAYVLGWSMQNVDYLLIGRFLSPEAVGIYKRAYQLGMDLPVHRIISPANSVLFPALSRLQDDGARLRYALSRAMTGIHSVVLPGLAGLVVMAPELIPLVFGRHWREAIVPTQILCGVGALQGIAYIGGCAHEARGYVAGEAVYHGIGLALTAIGLTIVAPLGLIACCWVVLGVNVVHFAAVAVVVRLATGWRARDYGTALGMPLLSSAAVAAALLMTGHLLGATTLVAGWRLVLTCGAGLGAFLAVSLVPRGSALRQTAEDLVALLARRRSACPQTASRWR